jgi:two-component system chemotaxis response regulator CheB
MIRVLVIDDSVAVRSMVSALLKEDPEIEVAGVAPDGRVGLAKFHQLRPDVVTLDVEMPDMDGLATPQSAATIPPPWSSCAARGPAAAPSLLSTRWPPALPIMSPSRTARTP